MRSPAWLPDAKTTWEAWAGPAELPTRPQVANVLMVQDLVRAIEQGGKPCCNEEDGRWTIEMVHSVYQAQKTGGRVALPLRDRAHPLAAY